MIKLLFLLIVNARTIKYMKFQEFSRGFVEMLFFESPFILLNWYHKINFRTLFCVFLFNLIEYSILIWANILYIYTVYNATKWHTNEKKKNQKKKTKNEKKKPNIEPTLNLLKFS